MGVSMKFKKCVRDVSMVFQGSLNSVSRVYSGSFKCVWRNPLVSGWFNGVLSGFKWVPKLFREVSRKCQVCLGKFIKKIEGV